MNHSDALVHVITLKEISGLVVTYKQDRGEHLYTFVTPDGRSYDVFGYKKAKQFANGIKLGRQLGVNDEETS